MNTSLPPAKTGLFSALLHPQRNSFYYVTAGLIGTAVLIRIIFWAYTDRIWEDALISILHAENFLNGLGFTHIKPDEAPIHGFTSPLSVLIPLIGGVIHHGFALDFMRLASLLAAALTVLFAALVTRPILNNTKSGAPLIFAVCGYLALEHHQILWGMAGMETQLVCACVLFSIYSLQLKNWRWLGVSLGLCMLARPDYAIWCVIAGLFTLRESIKTKTFKPLVQVVGIALAIYLPWIVFTTIYYGSPVPNTILAKSAGYGSWLKNTHGFGAIWDQVINLINNDIMAPLGPSFAGNGTGFRRFFDDGWVAIIVSILALIGGGAALKERNESALPLCAFLLAFLIYIIFFVPVIFGWYIVPVCALTIILAAKGIELCAAPLSRTRFFQPAVWFLAAGYVIFLAAFLPTTFKGERNIQKYVETPVRIAIGHYLNEISAPDATIAGEPLGFIGYYSRRAYYDYPGLASRRVVSFIKRTGQRSLLSVAHEIQPTYLVLRKGEAEGAEKNEAWFLSSYARLKAFEVAPETEEKLLFADANVDKAFVVYQRKAEADTSQAH